MGWRARVIGLVAVAAGVGGTAFLLKDSRVRPISEKDMPSAYSPVAIKLGSGHPVLIQISRCDVGATQSEFILKVHGEIENLGSTEIPGRRYSFLLADATGTLCNDRTAEEAPDSNLYALRPGERREFVFKYVVEPNVVRSALDLVAVESGTNRIQLKTSVATDLRLAESEWRVFRGPVWK